MLLSTAMLPKLDAAQYGMLVDLHMQNPPLPSYNLMETTRESSLAQWHLDLESTISTGVDTSLHTSET